MEKIQRHWLFKSHGQNRQDRVQTPIKMGRRRNDSEHKGMVLRGKTALFSTGKKQKVGQDWGLRKIAIGVHGGLGFRVLEATAL